MAYLLRPQLWTSSLAPTPTEPKPRGRVRRLGFDVLELFLPFVASWIASRKLSPPTTEELDSWIQKNESLFTTTHGAADQVDALVDADLARSASLEAKAVAILQGVAIVSAVLVGVEVVAWASLSPFQQGCFVVSDCYAVAAFLQSIRASRPKVHYVYTELDIEEQAKAAQRPSASRPTFNLVAAARRLAYVRANFSARLRLSNDVEAALGSVRNSLAVALCALIPYAWDRIGGPLTNAVEVIGKLARQ